ncbi:MAG: hypothetical protein EZS28_045427 [Streblomastix strix]|uniref:Uncharacterized protein n=1 Tax=Streblomastix strix TaxID=222440 RepID=A0A5J4TKN3_9EUKA|nr:MAG: hypothetical protein EZS28_045427 [Streblomastix strix]
MVIKVIKILAVQRRKDYVARNLDMTEFQTNLILYTNIHITVFFLFACDLCRESKYRVFSMMYRDDVVPHGCECCCSYNQDQIHESYFEKDIVNGKDEIETALFV